MLLVGKSSSPLHVFQRQANSHPAIFNMHPLRPPWGHHHRLPNGETARRSVLEGFYGPGLGAAHITSTHILTTGPQSHATSNSQGKVRCPGGHRRDEELADCHSRLLRLFAHHVPSVLIASPGPTSSFYTTNSDFMNIGV